MCQEMFFSNKLWACYKDDKVWCAQLQKRYKLTCYSAAEDKTRVREKLHTGSNVQKILQKILHYSCAVIQVERRKLLYWFPRNKIFWRITQMPWQILPSTGWRMMKGSRIQTHTQTENDNEKLYKRRALRSARARSFGDLPGMFTVIWIWPWRGWW